MTDYAKVLIAVAPHGNPAIRAGFAASLPDAIARAALMTPIRLAHFLAQTAHESAGFATTTEYASGRAYEGRRDLGNVEKGDGAKFKGRGLIQLTGRSNYRIYGAALNLDLIGYPPLASEFPAAALTAAEYWRTRSINRDADFDSIEGVTRRVNGGLNGLASRKAYLVKAKAALADLKGALTDAAAVETKAAKVRTQAAVAASVTAGAAPTAAIVPTAETHAALGSYGELALIAISIVAIAAAIWFTLSIRKHQNAADALTAAAKEI